MKPFANKKLELLLLQVFVFIHAIRCYLITIFDHVNLQLVHFKLQFKIFDGMEMTIHLDASIFKIRRCWNLLVEARLDTRMKPIPFGVH
jgi:hypothetical protein